VERFLWAVYETPHMSDVVWLSSFSFGLPSLRIEDLVPSMLLQMALGCSDGAGVFHCVYIPRPLWLLIVISPIQSCFLLYNMVTPLHIHVGILCSHIIMLLQIPYPARLSFQIEGEIKNFSDKPTLKEYCNTKPILKELL